MTNERAEVMTLLGEISKRYPELRLGQIIDWFASTENDGQPEMLYDVEDSRLIAAMREHLANPLARPSSCRRPDSMAIAS